ncbi:SGNH/GDSL hydrolase family protein [Stenotrophomonas phage StenR_269]|nr:SGNH/GDSL hydrolase family protein [Stenotrophomonas phage StenR_269]
MIFNKNPLRQARNPNSQLPVSDDKVQEIVKNLGIYQPSQELEATIRVVGVAIEGLADKEEVQEAIDVIDGKVDTVDAKVDVNTAAISSLEVQTGQNTANITSTNNDLQAYKTTNNSNVSLLQTNITTNTADITLLKESQSTGQVGYTSWTDLQAAPATTAGSLGQVIGDSGTHTDPVTGTVVANSGQYRWTGAAWQWIRADAISSKLDTSAANPRTIDFLHRDGFVAGQITGPVSCLAVD